MLSQQVQRALASWVERGRDRAAINDGRTFVLRYGRRFNLHQTGVLCVFVFFFALSLIVAFQHGIGAAAFNLVCVVAFGCLTLVSITYVTYALTIRVVIDEDQVLVRCFGLTILRCTSDAFETAYKSPAHQSVVLQSDGGKKTRISTPFDGLRALVACYGFARWILRPLDTSPAGYTERFHPDMDDRGSAG